MKPYLKLALSGLALLPVFAAAYPVDELYIYSQLSHSDIDGITGGGPFLGTLYTNSHAFISNVFLYCDSTSQDFAVGDTFNVVVSPLDVFPNVSLDPWVMANANSQAAMYDTANSVTLSTPEIESAIQGVIWDLDGQIAMGPMSSGDPNVQGFANMLYSDALSYGTVPVPGYWDFDAGIDYQYPNNGPGQSQVGYCTPEPSPLLALAVPAIGFAFRRRKK